MIHFLDFHAEVSRYTLQYEAELQQTIMEARNPKKSTNENDVRKLVESYENSDFNIEFYLFDYFTERQREINAIFIIYFETVKKNEPQIAAYKDALIPFAIVTKRVVFVATLKVLPDFNREKYKQYLKEKKQGKYEEKRKLQWYNNNRLVGSIGHLWRAYKHFFESNSQKVR